MFKDKARLYIMPLFFIYLSSIPTLAISTTLPASWSFQSSSNLSGYIGSGSFTFTSAAPHADDVIGSVNNVVSFNWDSGNSLIPNITLSDLTTLKYVITDPSHSFTFFTFAAPSFEINDISFGLRVDDDNGEIYTFSSFQPVATVPIPAAVWLMASSILGLIGYSRMDLKNS